ncbi:hypothetical protein C9J85_14930 [Haloferax sp. wsp5]|nr:hypothetical protein C9J85_14930 [Haloferax sp. wsp5]
MLHCILTDFDLQHFSQKHITLRKVFINFIEEHTVSELPTGQTQLFCGLHLTRGDGHVGSGSAGNATSPMKEVRRHRAVAGHRKRSG